MTKNSKLVTVISSAILAVIMAAAIVIGILGGVQGWGVFNGSASVSDSKTVTVSVSQYLYKTEGDALKAECDKAFENIDVLHVTDGEMSGDESEIVYVFAAEENVAKAVENLENAFAELTKEEGKWNGYDIKVTVNQVQTQNVLTKDYVLRGCIAGVVIAVLAFAYVALRHQWVKGIVAGACALLAMLTTTAIVLATRILVTPAVAYAIAASSLLTLVAVLFNLNKLSNNAAKEEETTAEELVATSIAGKEIVLTTVLLGLAVVVMGVLGGTQFAWLSVSALVAIVVAAFFGLVYAPVLCVPVQQAADKKAALRTNYKGAKKTSLKIKDLFKKKEKVEEEPVAKAEQAEETVETVEEPVEETETVEEAVETEETEKNED